MKNESITLLIDGQTKAILVVHCVVELGPPKKPEDASSIEIIASTADYKGGSRPLKV